MLFHPKNNTTKGVKVFGTNREVEQIAMNLNHNSHNNRNSYSGDYIHRKAQDNGNGNKIKSGRLQSPDSPFGEEDAEVTRVNLNTTDGNKKLTDMTEDEIREEAEMWKGVGNRHMANKEYTKAYTSYSTAISICPLGPSSHIFLSNRAASLLSLKRYSAANVDARRSIALAPTFGKAHARLGQSLYFLKDYKGAVTAYEDAFKYEPDNQVTWTYLNKARKKLIKQQQSDKGNGAKSTIGNNNDLMSVSDSVNLANMKINIGDDASDSKGIAAAVLTRDHYDDNKSHTKEQEDSNNSDEENFDHRLRHKMQAAATKSHGSFLDVRKERLKYYSPSRKNVQQMNKQTKRLTDETPYDKISDAIPSDEVPENIKLSLEPPLGSEISPTSNVTTISPERNEERSENNTNPANDPDFNEALFLQKSATDHLLNRHYRLSVEEFSAALFLVPDDDNLTPLLFVGRAHALNGQGRHVSAQNDAVMALGRKPDLADGHIALARSLFYSGDFERAIKSFGIAKVSLGQSCETLSKLDELYLEKAEEGLKQKELEGYGIEEEASVKTRGYSILSQSSTVPKLQPPRFVPREKQMITCNTIPMMPKTFLQREPLSPPSLRVGPEREVLFLSDYLGIKLNRGSDGIVRIISVSDDANVHRKGSVESGDVIREAGGVDLRRPITNIMWSDTIALLKMSPRPVKFMVSRELSEKPLGFRDEVSRSKIEFTASRRTYISENTVEEEEEKTEIRRLDNIHFEPPSRSGGNESVADSSLAAERDGKFLDDTQAITLPAVTELKSNDKNRSTIRQVEDHLEEALQKKEIDIYNMSLKANDGNLDIDRKESAIIIEGNQNTTVDRKKETPNSKTSLMTTAKEDTKKMEHEKQVAMTETSTKGKVDKVHVDLKEEEEKNATDNKAKATDVLKTIEPNEKGNSNKKKQETVGKESNTIELKLQDFTSNHNIISKNTSSVTTGKIPTYQSSLSISSGLSMSTEDDMESVYSEISSLQKTAKKKPLPHEDLLYKKQILFERPTKDKPTSPFISNEIDWTNEKWSTKSSSRELIFCGWVYLVAKGRFFWSGKQYISRVLALYKDPNLLLVLRPPRDLAEVSELLNIPNEFNLSSKNDNGELQESFFVAEKVIDLHTCKLRLSQLTTPTSVIIQPGPDGCNGLSEGGGVLLGLGGGGSKDTADKPTRDLRWETSFEIISPSFNMHISAVIAPPPSGDSDSVQYTTSELEEVYTGNSAIKTTSQWESVIKKALYTAHISSHTMDVHDTNKAWKHQVVLGSLHSHVVSGNYSALGNVLEIVKKGRDVTSNPSCFRPKKICLNKFDENGMTALHYACIRRSSTAVSMLVKAGADVTIPTRSECKTPCHLSSECLDEDSLMILLATFRPKRLDPNALDSYGRTPMYIATVTGKDVSGISDPKKLRQCLMTLESWGAQMCIRPAGEVMDENRATNQVKVMPHPIHSAAAEWRHKELEVVLEFCPHRYPIRLEGQSGFGRSLGALFDYPLHACAIALRKKLIQFKKKRRSDMFGNITGEPPLISTLRILLNHGLEPNERLEYVNSATEFALEMNEMSGFSPVQILAGAALDIISDKKESQEKELDSDPSLEFVSFYVAESVELLIKYGARIALDSPPPCRPNRENPLEHLVIQLSQGGMTNLPMIDREKLYIEKNEEFISFFGGKNKLNRLKSTWNQIKTVKGPGKIPVGRELRNDIPDYELPGGSDSKSCATCWKSFGILRNRKHTCRLSRRYVCEDCSSKCVLVEGQSVRVADGQYNFAKFYAEVKRKQDFLEQKEKTEARKLRMEKLQATTWGKKAMSPGGNAKDDDSSAMKEELFSGSNLGKVVKGFFNMDDRREHVGGKIENKKSANDELTGIAQSLNQTRNAFNERGERLNTLSDKTSALKDASSDFAKMAKELNKSQQSGFFW